MVIMRKSSKPSGKKLIEPHIKRDTPANKEQSHGAVSVPKIEMPQDKSDYSPVATQGHLAVPKIDLSEKNVPNGTPDACATIAIKTEEQKLHRRCSGQLMPKIERQFTAFFRAAVWIFVRTSRLVPRKKTTFKRIMQFLAIVSSLAFLAIISGGLIIFILYSNYGQDIPNHQALKNYAPPTISQVYSADGLLIDEFAHESRLFVPFEEIPSPVLQAFISAEDANFFEHKGYDIPGIIRAGTTFTRSLHHHTTGG